MPIPLAEHPIPLPDDANSVPEQLDPFLEHSDRLPNGARLLPEHSHPLPDDGNALPEHQGPFPEHSDPSEHQDPLPQDPDPVPDDAMSFLEQLDPFLEHQDPLHEGTRSLTGHPDPLPQHSR